MEDGNKRGVDVTGEGDQLDSLLGGGVGESSARRWRDDGEDQAVKRRGSRGRRLFETERRRRRR